MVSEIVFSLILPVYNVEKHLRKCMNSILNQTFKGNIEIILIDDGSTDQSGKICDEYAAINQKIKVIHKKMADCVQQGIVVCNMLLANTYGL